MIRSINQDYAIILRPLAPPLNHLKVGDIVRGRAVETAGRPDFILAWCDEHHLWDPDWTSPDRNHMIYSLARPRWRLLSPLEVLALSEEV